jgi:hypothetical protein
LNANKTVLVLGGYGNFGARIVAELARDPDLQIWIGGRNLEKASAFAKSIGGNVEPIAIDHDASNFPERVATLKPTVVIHTAGPFQGQGYNVARACIEARVHYVDIADGRDFVAAIDELNDEAQRQDCLVVAGASSLPALSSAVVDRYIHEFDRIETIEHAITSGAKPPGVATMHGVLGYAGKPFTRWQANKWQTAYGWLEPVAIKFPAPVGRRWLVNCDVPDLALFPKRYPSVHTVQFRAGIGFAATTVGLCLFAWMARARLIHNLAAYAGPLHQAAKFIEPLGTTWSAMRVRLVGIGKHGHQHERVWTLLAGDNHGPNIPCFPAIALTRKLLRKQIVERGAKPCMGLLSVDEILGAVPGLNLRVID